MNILFYRYNSICEPDIIATFREFGYTVREYTAEMTDKNVKPSDTVKAVSELLQKEPADLVFSINYYPALSEVCNLFHIRYVSWTVDSPVPELFHPSIRNEWNRTFLFDSADYREVSGICQGSDREHVFYQPLAARLRPKEELFAGTTEEIRAKFTHDISFVGSLYTEKSPYRRISGYLSDHTRGYGDGIMKAQMKIFGYYFIEEILKEEILRDFKDHVPDFFAFGERTEHFWDDRKTVARYYLAPEVTAIQREHLFDTLAGCFKDRADFAFYTASDTSRLKNLLSRGTCNTLSEMPLVFHHSKININTTARGIRSGLPLRIFDILSAGGFVLTDCQSDIPEVFTPGEDLVVYTSEEELVGLTDYYLTHDRERIAIAEQGYDTLKMNCSMEKVLGQILLRAFE